MHCILRYCIPCACCCVNKPTCFAIVFNFYVRTGFLNNTYLDMAQAEDTELRDLVIEALEKNGSLAKIRALLRANIFLAFEDECQNIKQNVSLDNVLNIPEGVLSLCIIHEFLEFCNLKNTLFVYVSESRQGKEYRYEGKNLLADKLNLSTLDKEPILVSLLKHVHKQYQKKYISQDDTCKSKFEKECPGNYRDDQNCTYIVHEDSTGTSQSQSDNSSDEKNKLHLRLPLDTSDTDTSSDSVRDKTSSEYIANEHILQAQDEHNLKQPDIVQIKDNLQKNDNNLKVPSNFIEQKINNSSSDSTSYIELKPFNPLDKLMLNTTGLPIIGEANETNTVHLNIQPSVVEISSPVSISSVSTGSLKNDIHSARNTSVKSTPQSPKLEAESTDYSYDFMYTSGSSHIDNMSHKHRSQENIEDKAKQKSNQNACLEEQNKNCHSSHSSISISDVADLINESLSFQKQIESNSRSVKNSSKSHSEENNKFNDISFNALQSKHASDDSGDFSESPIPSLSNLSLDIHSD